MLKWLKALAGKLDPPAVDQWFHVTWSEAEVRLDVAPPGSAAWTASFRWDSITRVCFRAEGPFASDGLYVFTSERPESYAIPTDADGGPGLWEEILERGLFDAELAIEAAQSTDGLFCWPPLEDQPTPD